jgi:hypothetical protein
VLLTAQAYADRLAGSGSNPAFHSLVVKRLAPLVRCPHLSQLWLSASVLSDDADKLLLGKQPQLKQLLLLKLASSTDASLSAEAVSKKIWSVPSSWLLPVRDIQPVRSAWVDWRLDIAAIRQAALDSVSRQRTTILTSPVSSQLGGVRWGIEVQCRWEPARQSSMLGLFARAKNLPAGSFCRCTFKLECIAPAAVGRRPRRGMCKGSSTFDGRTAVAGLTSSSLGPWLGGLMWLPGLPWGCLQLAGSCCG